MRNAHIFMHDGQLWFSASSSINEAKLLSLCFKPGVFVPELRQLLTSAPYSGLDPIFVPVHMLDALAHGEEYFLALLLERNDALALLELFLVVFLQYLTDLRSRIGPLKYKRDPAAALGANGQGPDEPEECDCQESFEHAHL